MDATLNYYSMGVNTVKTDFSSRSVYKLLLPLGKHVQVLVIDTQEYAFLPQLLEDVKSIDISVSASNEAYWLNVLETLGLPEVNLIKQVTQDYDLVFSDSVQHLPVREGGTVCRFFKEASVRLEKVPLQRYGIWFAWPDWPTLRILIPDSSQGVRAAARSIPAYSYPYVVRVLSRCLPSLVTARIGEQGIILYRCGEKLACASYWEQIAEALGTRPDFAFLKTVPTGRWLIYPGITEKPRTDMVLVDEKGSARVLIKCARVSEQSRLLEEERSETIVNLLGKDLNEKLSKATAMVKIAGCSVWAYRLSPDHMSAGWRWRLLSSRNFMWAITRWLVKVAYKTAHPLPVSQFWETHGSPLEQLRDQNSLPEYMRDAAEEALIALEHHRFRAFSVLEHGELDMHNVRVISKNGENFRVLNWEYANIDGAPLVDLCYLLASCKAPPKLAAQCMGAYLEQMGYGRAMAFPLWLSYLARRWQWQADVPGFEADAAANRQKLLQMTTLIYPYLQLLEQESV